jgi:hypothetical protein
MVFEESKERWRLYMGNGHMAVKLIKLREMITT